MAHTLILTEINGTLPAVVLSNRVTIRYFMSRGPIGIQLLQKSAGISGLKDPVDCFNFGAGMVDPPILRRTVTALRTQIRTS